MLECSISELQCEVVQHPTKGIFGFLKKNAIIVATCKVSLSSKGEEDNIEEDVASEILATVKEEITQTTAETLVENDHVLDSFFEVDTISNEKVTSEEKAFEEENVIYDELALLIEDQLKELLSHSCFEIDVVEVDVRDNTALIFIDGEDAALLIGKEGYRYKKHFLNNSLFLQSLPVTSP
jgi:spoIIIJ-associated protein